MEGELRVDELNAAETLVKGSKNRITLCSMVPTEQTMSLQTGCMVDILKLVLQSLELDSRLPLAVTIRTLTQCGSTPGVPFMAQVPAHINSLSLNDVLLRRRITEEDGDTPPRKPRPSIRQPWAKTYSEYTVPHLVSQASENDASSPCNAPLVLTSVS